MPALSLDVILMALLPWLSAEARAALRATVAAGGDLDADSLARTLGLTNRFHLNRLLQREGLPPFGVLSDWISILALTLESEATGASLLHLAATRQLEPATCYRRFRRTLGLSWRESRERGIGWMLLKFRDRCARPPITPVVGAHRGAQSAFERRAPALIGLGRQGPRLVRESPAAARLARRGHPAGRIAATVPLAHGGFDVAVGPAGFALVTRAATATVERLHLRSLRFEEPFQVGYNPTRVAMSATGRAYVSNQFSGSLSIVDGLGQRVIGEIPVTGDPAPVLAAGDGHTVFVATNADRLYAIESDSGAIHASLPLPATSHQLALHPNRALLYVATRDAGTVLEVDQVGLKQVREFVVGGRTQGLIVAPDGTELYVANEQGGLDVIDLATGSLTASLELGGPAFSVAATPDWRQLYVGLVSAERVQVLDRETLRVVHTIPTGGVPRGIAFDPRTQTGLIANEAGWITVVA